MSPRRVKLAKPTSRWVLATLREHADLLDESALGQCVGKLSLVTAALGGIYWLLGLTWTWTALLPLLASLWIVTRNLGRLSRLPVVGVSSAYLTIAFLPLMALAAAVTPVPSDLMIQASPFSAGVYLIMLVIVLLRDALDDAVRQRKSRS